MKTHPKINENRSKRTQTLVLESLETNFKQIYNGLKTLHPPFKLGGSSPRGPPLESYGGKVMDFSPIGPRMLR